jgi:hypothetical protein
LKPACAHEATLVAILPAAYIDPNPEIAAAYKACERPLRAARR